MKKSLLSALLLILTLLSVTACGAKADYSFEGTVFTYNGKSFDLSTSEFAVNAITECTKAGDYIVVEGHISPKNSYYGIFSLKNSAFEKEYIGNNLTLNSNDISTIIYSSYADIYNSESEIIYTCVLSGDEYITWLAFSEDMNTVYVEISSPSSEDSRTESFSLT